MSPVARLVPESSLCSSTSNPFLSPASDSSPSPTTVMSPSQPRLCTYDNAAVEAEPLSAADPLNPVEQVLVTFLHSLASPSIDRPITTGSPTAEPTLNALDALDTLAQTILEAPLLLPHALPNEPTPAATHQEYVAHACHDGVFLWNAQRPWEPLVRVAEL